MENTMNDTTNPSTINIGRPGSVDHCIRQHHMDVGMFTVPCPVCMQQSGEPCVKPNTSRLLSRSAGVTHAARMTAADSADTLNADPRVHAVSVEDHDGEQVVFVYLADAWLYCGEGQFSAPTAAEARAMLLDATTVAS